MSKKRHHISASGSPAECVASIRSCPRSGEETFKSSLGLEGPARPSVREARELGVSDSFLETAVNEALKKVAKNEELLESAARLKGSKSVVFEYKGEERILNVEEVGESKAGDKFVTGIDAHKGEYRRFRLDEMNDVRMKDRFYDDRDKAGHYEGFLTSGAFDKGVSNVEFDYNGEVRKVHVNGVFEVNNGDKILSCFDIDKQAPRMFSLEKVNNLEAVDKEPSEFNQYLERTPVESLPENVKKVPEIEDREELLKELNENVEKRVELLSLLYYDKVNPDSSLTFRDAYPVESVSLDEVYPSFYTRRAQVGSMSNSRYFSGNGEIDEELYPHAHDDYEDIERTYALVKSNNPEIATDVEASQYLYELNDRVEKVVSGNRVAVGFNDSDLDTLQEHLFYTTMIGENTRKRWGKSDNYPKALKGQVFPLNLNSVVKKL